MTRTIALTLCLLSTSALAQQTSEDYDRDYKALSQQNMFLRDRPAPRVNTGRRPTRPAIDYRSPEVQERVLVLRGVVVEDAELHAYVENTHDGRVLRLSPGDTVARGRISDIAVDSIAYEVEGRQLWVEVGENLAGGQSQETPTTQAATTAPAAQGTPGTPTPLPPGGGTLEERLRARRQQLQKK